MLSKHIARHSIGTAAHVRKVGAFQTFATQPDIKNAAKTDLSFDEAKPYDSIPGPTIWSMSRDMGAGAPLESLTMIDMMKNMMARYGKIYRLRGSFGSSDVIMTFNPNDYPVVFRNEGIWPNRRNFKAVHYYREVYRKDFFEGVEGISSTQDEKWGKMRGLVNPILMQPKNAVLYLNNLLEVNEEFLQRIREIRDPVTQEMPETFEDELNRFTLESVNAVALNGQFGLIRKNRDSAEGLAFVKATKRFPELAYYLDVTPPVWKYFPTPTFKEMMNTLDTMTNICDKFVTESLDKIEKQNESKASAENGKERSVLEKLAKVNKKFAVVMALDMIMAGVDTTSSALFGLLLAISTNPEKQEKLFQEVKQILPEKNSTLTLENMRHMPYLRACIKESLRMYPFGGGVLRKIPKDVVLSGYQVPAGTEVSVGTNILMSLDEFAPRAREYLPERWLRHSDETKEANHPEAVHPFLFLPFGFGPRSCVGMRIVNLELEILLARLVRNFKLEYKYPYDKPFKGLIFMTPNIPLKFKMAERSE